MASQIIEGRIEPTAPDRIKRGYGYYKSLTIHQPGGARRELPKVSAGPAVRDLIAKGVEGQFHTSKHAGMLGIHGIRAADGSKTYAHFNNFETLMVVLAGIAMILLVLFLVGKEVPLLALVIGLAFTVYYPFARKGRLEAEREFHGA